MAFLLIIVYNIKANKKGGYSCAAKEETTLYTQNTIKKIFH